MLVDVSFILIASGFRISNCVSVGLLNLRVSPGMCAQKTEIIVMMRALQLATGKTVISMLTPDVPSHCFMQRKPSGKEAESCMTVTKRNQVRQVPRLVQTEA